MREKIRDILSSILGETFTYDGENMIEDGMIDSVEMMELVAELEREYNIEIEPEDIIPENFKTIDTIVELVDKIKS